ncbi:hypothetical protein scyTo_0005308 [Scyliorhinus torazame]|uniref:Uncharacterized protein n=1 Tax=Scyliorhinus torazame TaxID=75743 RepID=A0A401P5U6_SCYTO|nr:hypothetical protein [Scyliorhinus torazame]
MGLHRSKHGLYIHAEYASRGESATEDAQSGSVTRQGARGNWLNLDQGLTILTKAKKRNQKNHQKTKAPPPKRNQQKRKK